MKLVTAAVAAAVFKLALLGGGVAVAQNPCHCIGYSGPGGPCYDGPGGRAYSGLGGPAYAGPGGPCYAGPGGPAYSGPGGRAYFWPRRPYVQRTRRTCL